MAKWVSLVVKAGALVFIVFIPLQYAIWLQLLGGVFMIQTFPSVILGLFTRWFHPWALALGWLVGTALGIWMFFSVTPPGPVYPMALAGHVFPGYTALYTLALNLAVAVVLTIVFKAMGAREHADQTRAADYYV